MAEKNNKLMVDEMSEKIIQAAEKLVTSQGAYTMTVRKVLQELNITNRVFYNRFHNIDQVLEIVYEKKILKMRESLKENFDPEKDFFEQVMNVLERTLLMSYEVKQKFNHYVFEHDSLSRRNYEWWISEIKKLVEYAKSRDYIKDVDSDMLSYSIWCFCRGYNADAVGRNISIEDALKSFRCGFGLFFDGLRKS